MTKALQPSARKPLASAGGRCALMMNFTTRFARLKKPSTPDI
jgi:hypothetical protein